MAQAWGIGSGEPDRLARRPSTRRADRRAMAVWEPTRTRQSGVVTFRLSRMESFVRAVVGSQTVILMIACLAAPDGSGGDGAHIDVSRLIVVLVKLYLAASLLGVVIGYPISRRTAVEITPEGFSIGRKRTGWVDVSSISVKKTRTGAKCIKAGKRALPAPISVPLRPNPRFDQALDLITNSWETHHTGA